MLFASKTRSQIAALTTRRRSRPQVEPLEARLALSAALGSLSAHSAHHFSHPVDVTGHHTATRPHPHPGHRRPMLSGHGHGLAGHEKAPPSHGGPAGPAGLVSIAAVQAVTATTTTFNGSDYAYGTAFQADGKIVVAGTTGLNSSSGMFAVARYNSDLTLDTSFGNGGKQTTAITPHYGSYGYAMAIDATNTANNGKIVVAGTTYSTSYKGNHYSDFAVARYTTAGGLDTTFGGGRGYVTTNTSSVTSGNDEIFAVAIDGQDRVIAAGQSSNGSHNVVTLARYTSAGALDTSFNSSGPQRGVIRLDFGQDADAQALVVDGNGNYLVSGTLNTTSYAGQGSNTSNGVFIARFTPAGVLDPTFGNGGIRLVSSLSGDWDHFNAMTLDASGNIVVAGTSMPSGSVPPDHPPEILLARFTPSGNLDSTFGSGAGFVTQGVALGYSVAIDPRSGAILVGAESGVPNSPSCFDLTRFLPDGTLDTSFNGTGTLLYAFPGYPNEEIARGLAIGTSGNYVQAGWLESTGGSYVWGVLNVQA
jgi:uncharacterized delta-60 repeat protein